MINNLTDYLFVSSEEYKIMISANVNENTKYKLNTANENSSLIVNMTSNIENKSSNSSNDSASEVDETDIFIQQLLKEQEKIIKIQIQLKIEEEKNFQIKKEIEKSNPYH